MSLNAQTCVDIFLIDWTEPQDLVNDKDMTVEKAPVSCWRSLFVANEWNELQTLRITSLEVTMFFAIFLLSGVSLEEGAKVSADEGDLEDRDVDMSSQMLRFGISASIFTLIEARCLLWLAPTPSMAAAIRHHLSAGT